MKTSIWPARQGARKSLGRPTRTIVAAAVAALGATATFAQVSTGNLTVTATVANVCTMAATTVDFSVLNLGSATNEATPGRVEIACTANQGNVNVVVGGGQYASGGSRRLSNGAGNFIPYSIFTTSTRTGPVAVDGPIFNGALSGTTLQTLSIYGQVPSGMYPAGTYNDVLLVTMNY